MLLALVNILVVWVARGNSASLGAPATIRSIDTRLPVIHNTALPTEAVPVSASPFYVVPTDRKVSAPVPEEIIPKHVQNPLQVTPVQNLQNNDRSLSDTSDNITESTVSTVSTTEEQSFEDLLDLARIKYLGHSFSGKTNFSSAYQLRKTKSRVRLSSPRKAIIENNKKRSSLHQPRLGSSRLKLRGVKFGGTGITQVQNPISTINMNESKKTEISTTTKVQQTKAVKFDISSQTTIPTTNDMLTINKAHTVDLSLDQSPPRKRMTKLTDGFHLLSNNEEQSAISRHHGRSLTNQGEYIIPHIQNVFSDPKTTHAILEHSDSLGLDIMKLPKEDENISKPSIEEPESDNDYENTEGSADDDLEIFDGQYHEVNPGQYHEENPGQYHEVNPGQYHELNPGQYHETHPGQYHEINPGQEVQLNVEFNPEEETKTYNVHKKTGDYIIGEVGKINVNNGQTLEGVRYTAVDGIVDQEQIAEILQRFFGTKTN